MRSLFAAAVAGTLLFLTALLPEAALARTVTLDFTALAPDAQAAGPGAVQLGGMTLAGSGGVLAQGAAAGALHLELGTGDYAAGLWVTAPARFALTGLSFAPPPIAARAPAGAAGWLTVTGSRQGVVTGFASLPTDGGAPGSLPTAFGPEFADLDWLELALVTPVDGPVCITDPCATVDLDGLSFEVADPAPVPLPGGLALALGGLGALGLHRRR